MTLSLEPGGGGLSLGLAVAGRASPAATATLRRLEGRDVALFRLDGGKHRGAIGPPEGLTIERLVTLATDLGVPIVGILATSGADIHEGVASLHAWGRVARQVSRASGVVPIVFAVVGPCTSGPALMLGLADHVVMTPDAFAYVSGPEAVAEFTGVRIDRVGLGGCPVHDSRTGVASLVAADEEDALLAVADLLSYLPTNHFDDAPVVAPATDDPLDRPCRRAAAAVPDAARASYDVRTVLVDVLDEGSLLEVRARYASNLVTAYGRLGGRPVGIIANQPQVRAGTLDIEASRKAARFVQHCDAFNLAVLTFVDTPGFEPGKDLEWRGMIRHGAELVHAYAAATVPRICLVLRKAYGGAYIVMDSRELGNDACFAWPGAEIAVMGSKGAVQILFGKRLAATRDPEERERQRIAMETDYDARFCSPIEAAERGLVDEVIDPHETRRVLGAALAVHARKRETAVARKHSISPC
ncbi:MAG TPA: carboxyl transferase domain-containing protein [Acidimicrobiia bacterium]|nr:carboxyl transferase domain-containing protein [Acidimicrobiia bacterium]